VNGVFELRAKNADGKEGIWTIDLKKEGKVTKGPVKGKPDVTISCSGTVLIFSKLHGERG
jgi:hypothetical protein